MKDITLRGDCGHLFYVQVDGKGFRVCDACALARRDESNMRETILARSWEKQCEPSS